MKYSINGIQQIGIGVESLNAAWNWYSKAFGFNVRVFEDNSVAAFMLPYTGGLPQKRHAALTVNMSGGGGLEIWQYTERIPLKPKFQIMFGDLGINAIKIKCRSIDNAYKHLVKMSVSNLSAINTNPDGSKYFFLNDPFGNLFQVVETNTSWFSKKKSPTGGVLGAIIGVTNMDRSLKLYQNVLGYSKVISDQISARQDFMDNSKKMAQFRSVLLTHPDIKMGAFSELLGTTQIELIQCLDRQPQKIFENRFWGDLGYIHLCFDVNNMKQLEKECNNSGFPFTIDSASQSGKSFDMGEAAGHFSYIEDPDGTLIEFVETHKVPILKKLGIYFNLKKRDNLKPLPKWLIGLMGLNKYNRIDS